MTGYRVCPYCTRRARWRHRTITRIGPAVYRVLLWAPFRFRWYVIDRFFTLRGDDVPCTVCAGRHIYKERRR